MPGADVACASSSRSDANFMLSPSGDLSPCCHAQLLVDSPKAKKDFRKVWAPLKTSVPTAHTEMCVIGKLLPSADTCHVNDTNGDPCTRQDLKQHHICCMLQTSYSPSVSPYSPAFGHKCSKGLRTALWYLRAPSCDDLADDLHAPATHHAPALMSFAVAPSLDEAPMSRIKGTILSGRHALLRAVHACSNC